MSSDPAARLKLTANGGDTTTLKVVDGKKVVTVGKCHSNLNIADRNIKTSAAVVRVFTFELQWMNKNKVTIHEEKQINTINRVYVTPEQNKSEPIKIVNCYYNVIPPGSEAMVRVKTSSKKTYSV